MEKFNTRGLDLAFLMVFDVMMRRLNVTYASEELGVNQPNVSYAIKKLREFFNDELFVRSAGKMQPTPRALQLHGPISDIIHILKSQVLVGVGFDPLSSTRKFVINTTDIGEMTFIPPILRHFHATAPGLSVETVCLEPQELLSAMIAGRVDLALGYLPELNASTLYSKNLGQHPMVCLAREGNPFTVGEFNVKQYSRAQHIGLLGEGHAQRRIEEGIAKSGIQRRIAYQSHNFMSVPFIVLDSDLIATVPKMIAVAFAHLPGLVTLPVPLALDPIPIKQYWTEAQHNDPGQIWLRRVVSEIFVDGDPSTHLYPEQ